MQHEGKPDWERAGIGLGPKPLDGCPTRGLLFAVILRHLIIELRSLAATTSHQTINRAKIRANSTLSPLDFTLV